MEGALNHGKTPAVMEALSVPITQSVVGMVASTGVSASIGPDDYHHPVATQAGAADTLAMIAAPVLIRGKLAGVVSAINPRGGGLFSADDLERLSFNAYLLGLILADTHGLRIAEHRLAIAERGGRAGRPGSGIGFGDRDVAPGVGGRLTDPVISR